MVDAINGKKADIILTISHLIIALGVIYSLFHFARLTINPIREPMNTDILVFLILLCLFTLYSAQLGDYFKQPSIKIIQYSWLVFALSVFSLSYISTTFNEVFVEVLGKIKNIDVIPPDMLIGNVRVVTTLVPLAIILPVLYISLITLKDKRSKEKIRSFEFESLLPTVHKSDETTIDIEIGKDYKTGMPLVVPEKILYSHTWVQGSSGSGKTSNLLLPLEEQLLRQKSYLNYNLKKIAMKCLEDGIAYINKPITNEWLNENFSMQYIEPRSGREEEFYKAFEKFTIGIISADKAIHNEDFAKYSEFMLNGLKSKDYKYVCNLTVRKNGMPFDEIEFEITKGNEIKTYENPYLVIQSKFIPPDKSLSENDDGNFVLNEDYNSIFLSLATKELMKDSTNTEKTQNTNEDVNNSDNEGKNIDTNKAINKNTNEYMSYSIKIEMKGSGRIVPKNLGMTVVAPDGELINTTVEMGKNYGVKVHKIDPDKSEILRGNVATFNPLIGDSPEKIGDIVASILVTMDAGNSNKSNPYFTNASVRAIRNLVILLKITFKDIYKKEPTLADVLKYLNNMNATSVLLARLMDNQTLFEEYRTVADYFVTSFIDKDIIKSGSNDSNYSDNDYGSLKKETQRALGGIINQLDNLLGREEIRKILCPEHNSLDLAEVLRNGECIAISTRQGNLGPRLGKAFALFFILSLQNEVLSRYAENENPEIPHFLIIDEFPMYCNENTETFFTFARKYKCAVTIAIQNMAQLKKVSDEFGETIFTNTSTKILMANSNIEDRKYWSDFFGTKTDMEYMTGIATSSVFADNPSYSEQIRGSVAEVKNVTEEELDNLKFKQMMFSYTNSKGRKQVGKATTDFVDIKSEPYMRKLFDFERFSMSEEEYSKILVNKERAKLDKKRMETQRKAANQKQVDEDLFEIKPNDEEINQAAPQEDIETVENNEIIEKTQEDTKDTQREVGGIEKALLGISAPTKPKIDVPSDPKYVVSSSVEAGDLKFVPTKNNNPKDKPEKPKADPDSISVETKDVPMEKTEDKTDTPKKAKQIKEVQEKAKEEPKKAQEQKKKATKSVFHISEDDFKKN